MNSTFYSNGKLLLTGEYGVLDGALSLAIPTKYGQLLSVKKNNTATINWTSVDEEGKTWFQSEFSIRTNIADWAQVDAYTLLWNSFSGSAYDIACAKHNYPITYKLHKGKPEVTKLAFDPPFKDQLYFIYLNKKQNSREGIAKYKSITLDKTDLLKTLSELTLQIAKCTHKVDFNTLLTKHENLLSSYLQIPTQKESLFPDFTGAIKSLGAWGGDFILATGTPREMRYFKRKGYFTMIPYQEMVL